jgi:rubredoxin
MPESAHAGKTVHCRHPDDDSIEDPDPTELTFETHGQFVSNPRGDDRHGTPIERRFEASALRFDCPDCDAVRWVCPICSDHLRPDSSDVYHAPGWYYGKLTGDALACGNCNQEEAPRQHRGPVSR